MPYALATRDWIGRPVFLAEARDGSFRRVDCPLNARLWETEAELRLWLQEAPDADLEALRGKRLEVMLVSLDLTGATVDELAPPTETSRPRVEPAKLSWRELFD